MKFFAFALLALTAVVGVSAHIPPAVTEAAGQLGIALTGLTNSTSAIVAAFTKNVLDDVEQVSSSIIQLQTVLTKKLSDTLGGGLVSGVATSALSALVSAANNLLQSVSTDLAKIFTGPLAVLNAPINSLNSKIQSLLNGTGTTVGAVLKCAENDLAQDLGIVNNVTANVQDLVNKLIANYKKQTDDILTPFTTKLNKVILDLANFSLGRIPAIASDLLSITQGIPALLKMILTNIGVMTTSLNKIVSDFTQQFAGMLLTLTTCVSSAATGLAENITA